MGYKLKVGSPTCVGEINKSFSIENWWIKDEVELMAPRVRDDPYRGKNHRVITPVQLREACDGMPYLKQLFFTGEQLRSHFPGLVCLGEAGLAELNRDISDRQRVSFRPPGFHRFEVTRSVIKRGTPGELRVLDSGYRHNDVPLGFGIWLSWWLQRAVDRSQHAAIQLTI